LEWDVVPGWIEQLDRLLAIRREADIIEHIRQLVPEYSARPALAPMSELAPTLVGSVQSARQSSNGTGSGGHEHQGSGAPIVCEQ